MKLITILLSIICLFISPASAYGIQTDVPISITVNDNYIKMDVPPFLYRDYTYVPVRFVSQALGADSVSWDSQNDTALVQYGGNTIKLQIGKNYGYVNGKYTPIKTGIMLISGRTFVPVRFVAETMGAQVLWEQDYLNVKITKQNVLVPASIIEYKSYTKEDIYWLSRIIEAESAGEPLSGKIAVGNVVLNRVKSPFYPNTIKEVIFDRENGVQFEPTINGTIYNKPTSDSVIAAIKSLEGVNVVGDSLFFLNPKIASSSWITKNRIYNTTIGNHEFYL